MSTKDIYFSVSYTTRIGDTKFRPAICYEIPESCRDSVEKLVQDKLATLYEEEVRFVSGIAREINKTSSSSDVSVVPSSPSQDTAASTARSSTVLIQKPTTVRKASGKSKTVIKFSEE